MESTMASGTDWRVPLWPDHSKSPTVHPPPPGAALNDKALFALPYAGQLAGVSRSAPTHAVFAIFDPSTMGLRFVKGDGTFVEAAEVLFNADFKDLSEPSYGELLMRKRSNELWVRSKVYYHQNVVENSVHHKWTTRDDVKNVLFHIDSHDLHRHDVPALGPCHLPEYAERISHSVQVLSLPLTSSPRFDFDPRRLHVDRFYGTKHFEVVEKYHLFDARFRLHKDTNLMQLVESKFMLAAYCLQGLLKADLIPFFPPDQLVDLKLEKEKEIPLGRWTADCFLARFPEYEQYVVEMNLAEAPNPALWLESVLDEEFARGLPTTISEHQEALTMNQPRRRVGLGLPWKGVINLDSPRPTRFEGMFTFQEIRGMEWLEMPHSVKLGNYPGGFGRQNARAHYERTIKFPGNHKPGVTKPREESRDQVHDGLPTAGPSRQQDPGPSRQQNPGPSQLQSSPNWNDINAASRGQASDAYYTAVPLNSGAQDPASGPVLKREHGTESSDNSAAKRAKTSHEVPGAQVSGYEEPLRNEERLVGQSDGLPPQAPASELASASHEMTGPANRESQSSQAYYSISSTTPEFLSPTLDDT